MSVAEAATSSCSVLVIEDCELQQRAYRRALVSLGHTATTIGTLAEALVATSAKEWRKRAFDIVIADLSLHGEDASPAIAQAIAADPPPVVAVVTGHLDAALSLKFARLGALYFPKPFAVDHATALLRLVEARHDGGLSIFVSRFGLSPREREAVKNALQRKSLREAAERMRISATTLREYWARIFEKTGVRSQQAIIETVTKMARGGGQPAHEDKSLAASTAKMPEKR